MSDPSRLDIQDYFAAAVTGIVAGLGGAMAWFSGSKKALVARMDGQDDRMAAHDLQHAEHSTQLAVIHTNQDHLSNRLDEIRDSTEDIKQEIQRTAQAGAHSVNTQIAQLINEVQLLRHTKR